MNNIIRRQDTCCLIFCRTPEAGKTKTRLIPALGAKAANQLHIKLSNHTLKLASITHNINFEFYHTDTENKDAFNDLYFPNNIISHNQTGIDLGERMYNASCRCLKQYSHCLIIGTDCPELSDNYLIDAKNALVSGSDIVIGPAYDGGYVLIGLSSPNKKLFTNITWGTNSVLTSTICNINNMNLKYQLLKPLHDIDTENDLEHLMHLNIN